MSTAEQTGAEPPVKVIEHASASGRVLVQAQLNSESTLNAGIT